MCSHMCHAVTHGDHSTRKESPPTCGPRGGSQKGIRAPFSLDPKREVPDPGPSLSKYSQWAEFTRAFIKTTVGESELS